MPYRALSAIAVSIAVLLSTACGSGAPEPSVSSPVPSVGGSTSLAQSVASADRRKPGDPMCGFAREAPSRYKHVVWIWFENRSYGDIVGSEQAPYTNRLGRRCGLATDFHNETHPSLPNYIAGIAGTTAGIDNNCDPADCPVSQRSLFRQVERHGKRWKSYSESMPGRCARHDDDPYAVRHNPAPYFEDIAPRCKQNNPPLGTTSSGAFVNDIQDGSLPAFSFVTPNLCNDTHDCPISAGDDWLKRWIPRLVRGQDYRAGRTAIFVSWDEGSGAEIGRNCVTSNARSCHIPTYVIGPAVDPKTRVSKRYTHYSMLKTTEKMLGIHTYLKHADDAKSMRKAFGL